MAPALGLLLLGSPARAATGGRLTYSAPDGCATQADFEASVAERGGHFELESAAAAMRELRVSIVQESHGFRGSFQTLQNEGASAIRELHGATCSEVVAALAVVSAIELRGEAESSAPLPGPAPAPTSAARRDAPPAPESAKDEGRLRASSMVDLRKKVSVSAGTLRFDVARSVTLLAGAELGLLPAEALPRYDLSFDTATFVTTPDGESYLAGVIPRIRLSYLGKETYRTTDASVSAQGVSAGISLCWSPTYDTRSFVALLCAEYGIGVMDLKSFDAQGNPTRWTSPALQTGGLNFETQYNLGSVLHLGLKMGVDALLQPIRAERADGSDIFHSSVVAGYGMLGLGVQF